MANDIRGEQAIVLGGVTYTMRPSWSALQAIEEQTGHAIVHLGQRAELGRLGGTQLAIIVTECIKADLRHRDKGGEADLWKVERVAELLMESEGGLVRAIQQLPAFLRDAVTGRYTAKGEAKAAGTGGKTSAPPAAV